MKDNARPRAVAAGRNQTNMAIVRRVLGATVLLWGKEVGAVAWDPERNIGSFQYDPGFVRQGLEVAPLTMPLNARQIYTFPAINRETYRGLPGLLADTLPDRFGNALIDIWLSQQGRESNDFNPVERLCYMGTRAMGALEFKPAIGPSAKKAIPVEISELTRLASEVLSQRSKLKVKLRDEDEEALKAIIRVGTSAGGARAKAVIAWNRKTNEVRSGQVDMPEGFEPWLLKFDGVNKETLGDPEGFGRIEYAYHKMALEAGITMSECHLFEEGGRAHFMTRRFDRTGAGDKIHMQSLCAMGHFDFNAAGEYSYEQGMGVIQKLNLGHVAMQELYRRAAFNIMARNQDDHTRNIAFLMDKDAKWNIAPAYDVTWNHRPDSPWVSRHQMRLNGKMDGFMKDDLLAVSDQFGIKGAKNILQEVHDAVSQWSAFAKDMRVPSEMIRVIARTHRLNLV